MQDIANEYRRRSEANHASNNGFAVISGDTSRLSDLDLFQPTTQNNSSNTGIIIKMDTILDADDGLHNLGVEWMQSMAVQYAQHQRQGMTTSRLDLASSWWVFCGTEHIEWHNREIYMLHPRDFEERGISSGITGVRKKPEFCTSAGFTRVGILEPPIQTVLYPRQAYLNHAQVIGKLLHCNITTLNHCYKREFPNIPLIVKSRSVTSDSMDHLNPQQANDYRDHTWHDSNHSPLWVNETENTWRVLEKEFGIDRFKAWKTSIYMHQHVLEIITENQAARW